MRQCCSSVTPDWYFCSVEGPVLYPKGARLDLGRMVNIFIIDFKRHIPLWSRIAVSNTFFGGDPAPGEKNNVGQNVDIGKEGKPGHTCSKNGNGLILDLVYHISRKARHLRKQYQNVWQSATRCYSMSI